MGGLDETFFQTEPCKAAFKRIHTVAKKRSIILGFTELLEDPALNEEYRDILRESEIPACKTVDRAHRLVESLDKYRKTRTLYTMAKDVLDNLKQAEVDVDEVLDEATNAITSARTNQELQTLVHTIGKDANALDLVDQALSEEDEVLLKVGFKEIDEKNGGVPSEGVLLLAATTSGGKSAMLMNLLTSMYRINKISVANVSLEMNEKKLSRRLLSSLTKIPYWKFVKKRLSDDEKALARKAWRRIHRYGEKYDAQYSFICPKRSVNATQLLTLLKPYKYKVIGIDYVSLLDGVDEKDQWKALSAIVRQCKIFSSENHCLVILLAQLDSDDDRIRYSKGMLEHADAAWTWNYYKPEQRESKRIPVKQLKARDQELFTFELEEQFEVMTIRDIAVDDSVTPDKDSIANGKKNGNSKKNGKPSGDDLNLNEEDDVAVDYEAGQK